MSRLALLLMHLLARLPRPALQAVGAFVGRCSFALNTRAAKVTRDNLAFCFPNMTAPEVAKLARESVVATGKTMLEVPAVWLGETKRLDRWVSEVIDEDVLVRALSDERGLILLLPHTGNWELFNIYFRRHGRLTALYQPPRSKAFHPLMREIRKHHGNDMVPTDGAGLRQLYRVLRTGGTVVVLPDQVPQQGQFAPFFGQPALTDELAIRLMRGTGAQVLVTAVVRQEDGRFAIHFREMGDALRADEDQALVTVNGAVEWAAQLALPQYQWEYKRFRVRPAGEPKLYRYGKPPQVH